MRNKQFVLFIMILSVVAFAGCASGSINRRHKDYPIKEADWIREGRPIIYEDQNWYPTEYVENHLDKEMDWVGEFQEVPFYVERRQIKPFNRIYTKFGYHKYRLFLKKKDYD